MFLFSAFGRGKSKPEFCDGLQWLGETQRPPGGLSGHLLRMVNNRQYDEKVTY